MCRYYYQQGNNDRSETLVNVDTMDGIYRGVATPL